MNALIGTDHHAEPKHGMLNVTAQMKTQRFTWF